MKKFFIIVFVVVLVVTWHYASQTLREYQNFQDAFGVSVPWFMNQGEQVHLQKVVTRKLLELSLEITIFSKGYPCNADDRECVSMRNLYVATSQRDLNKAFSAARALHRFDLTVPACGDGSYPVDERCFDGSIPHGLE